MTALVAVTLLTSTGCAPAQDATFRIRSDLGAPLNADTGWAGKVGEEVTVEVDRPFRLRMEIEPGEDGKAYALQTRRNEGAWETLEAHDFPHPMRELKLIFKGQAPGSIPPDWSVRVGGPDTLAVFEDKADRVLRASGGGSGLVALYDAPWPLPEFTFGARFRQPVARDDGFALIFGHDEAGNHYRVGFDPIGRILVARVIDGLETTLAEKPASFTPGAWHEAEVELKNGHLAIRLDDDAFELSIPINGGAVSGQPGIAVSPGATTDFAEFTLEGVARTPGVSIVATPAYADGEPTTDLITGSAVPFTAGLGISLTERTPLWTGAGSHGEFEWPLVIRRLADGAKVNDAGDRFEFRMVDGTGKMEPRGAVARVKLAIPPGHLGGTFVESPGRIGPWQAKNGDLYFIMEPTETDNKFMMMKSRDSGRSWHEVDGANRPRTSDLEAVDSRLVGDRIHIIHQVTQSVRYHVFRTSDHPTHPDSWGLRDEVAARAEAIAQTSSLAVRSDDSVVAFFLADRLHYAIRDTDGVWGAPIEIDAEATYINAGPQAILGRDDSVHLAYFSDDGGIWYRRLLPDGTLTSRQQLAKGAGTSRAEYGAVLPLVHDMASNTVTIAYRLANGTLWERRVTGGSAPTEAILVGRRPVITNAVDSQQPAADLVSDGGTSHILFVDENTRSILSTHTEGGRWQALVPRVEGIKGSWVRGNIIRKPNGSPVYGYVYDAGSEGGSGLNRYTEFPIIVE